MLCLHFARQDGQDGKKQKENHASKVTKIPKTKRRKYGMNITLGVQPCTFLLTALRFQTSTHFFSSLKFLQENF